MKMLFVSSLLLLSFILALPLPVLGCWAKPPEFVVLPSPGGTFFLRKVNSKKIVEVRRSKDLRLEWKVRLDDYSDLFSDFRLSDDGSRLAHIKGNHMVNSLKQVCIEVYGKAGLRDTYRVSELRQSLPAVPKPGYSTDPEFSWYTEIVAATADELVIRLDASASAYIGLREHRVTLTGK